MTETSEKPTQKSGGCHRRGRLFVGVLALAALATAGLAWAGTHAAASWAGCDGAGGGFGHRFARAHAEFAVDHALKAAQASPEQRAQVEAIVERAFAEHAKFSDEHRGLHDEALAILSAPTVDRTRLEALRAKHVAIAEEGSHQVTAAIADIADVLTPDQRQKLAAHVRQMFE